MEPFKPNETLLLFDRTADVCAGIAATLAVSVDPFVPNVTPFPLANDSELCGCTLCEKLALAVHVDPFKPKLTLLEFDNVALVCAATLAVNVEPAVPNVTPFAFENESELDVCAGKLALAVSVDPAIPNETLWLFENASELWGCTLCAATDAVIVLPACPKLTPWALAKLALVCAG